MTTKTTSEKWIFNFIIYGLLGSSCLLPLNRKNLVDSWMFRPNMVFHFVTDTTIWRNLAYYCPVQLIPEWAELSFKVSACTSSALKSSDWCRLNLHTCRSNVTRDITLVENSLSISVLSRVSSCFVSTAPPHDILLFSHNWWPWIPTYLKLRCHDWILSNFLLDNPISLDISMRIRLN